MDDNPYQSPTTVSDPPATASNRSSPVKLLAMGFLFGFLLGGTSGAIGSGLLGAVAGVTMPSPDPESDMVVEIIVFGIVFGGVCGIGSGAVVGPILGLFACKITEASRQVFVAAAAGVCGLVGGGFGVLAGLMLGGQNDWMVLWLLLSIGVGTASGAAGGFVLGRGLARLALGVRPRPAADRDA